MRKLGWHWLLVGGASLFCSPVLASLVPYSGNPKVPAGVAMFELHDPYTPNEAPGNPFLVEYGSAKTVFGPSDKVYLSIGFDLQELAETDMVQDPVGTKYAPRVWWQIWAPGSNVSSTPTWDYQGTYVDKWTDIRGWQNADLNYNGPVYYDTYFSGSGDDLWSIAGGFQSGTWSYRVSVEVPDAKKDPWITWLGDGWSAPFEPGDIGKQRLTGSANAVPEPVPLLLLAAGFAALALRRRD